MKAMPSLPLRILPSVSDAVKNNRPVVALESTVITHGLPYPKNFEVMDALERVAEESGAIAATICILDGECVIGLNDKDRERLRDKISSPDALEKIALKDLAESCVAKQSGGTTVSTTMYLAHLAGIEVFATGGIGGVHRGFEQTLDISMDLKALESIPIIVVSAGAKAILDIPATLEALESRAVPVYGWRAGDFPAFYSRKSGNKIKAMNSLQDIAKIYRLNRSMMGMAKGMLIANPIAKEDEIKAEVIEGYIQKALQRAAEQGIRGKALTPFLLSFLAEETKGLSVKANIALLKGNVRLAAKIATELCRSH